MNNLFVVVKSKYCHVLRCELIKRELLNSTLRCVQLNENKIAIPVKIDIHNNVDVYPLQDGSFKLNEIPFIISNEIEGINNVKSCSVLQKLKDTLLMVLEKKGLYEAYLDIEIPNSWEKYGDLLLFNGDKYFQSSVWKEAGSEIWPYVCKILNGKRIALKSYISPDGFRTPNVIMVWGESSWVDYMDNGIRYSWDVTKNMFCAGNAPERHRVAKLKCDGEVIVDLYAGIGYFTLPYLVYAGAKHVHACEWNPNAVLALRKNLIQNNVTDKCTIHEGDNERLQLCGIADRINLGLLPTCHSGWKVACKALKSTGGMLHLHENVTSGVNKTSENVETSDGTVSFVKMCESCKDIIVHQNLSPSFLHNSFKHSFYLYEGLFFKNDNTINWKKLEWKIWALHVSHSLSILLQETHNKLKWKISVSHLHYVKSYAPHVDHLVLDLQCQSVNVEIK